MSEAATQPAAEPATLRHPLYCSFCGKPNHEVAFLIAGSMVFICSECVEQCVYILHEKNVPMDLPPTSRPVNAQEVCPHGVRDPHACYVCTPRDAT